MTYREIDAMLNVSEYDLIRDEQWQAWSGWKTDALGGAAFQAAVIWAVRDGTVFVNLRPPGRERVILGDPIKSFPSQDLKTRIAVLL